jgi:hypothetical protein
MSISVWSYSSSLNHTPRQGAFVRIWALWAEIATLPPQTAVAELASPPVTVAALPLLAQTLLLLPLVTEAKLWSIAVTLLWLPLDTEAVLPPIAVTWLKFPSAEA